LRDGGTIERSDSHGLITGYAITVSFHLHARNPRVTSINQSGHTTWQQSESDSGLLMSLDGTG